MSERVYHAVNPRLNRLKVNRIIGSSGIVSHQTITLNGAPLNGVIRYSGTAGVDALNTITLELFGLIEFEDYEDPSG